MAEKRTINIDIKNNADETAKDFDTLNKSIDNTTKSTKNLNSTFEEVYGELQPLTTRMGEAEDRLYELALAGDTASKEYQELLTKVGEYRKVQIQTDLAVDGAATTMTQKLGSALNGATSGFAATQGAMALLGSENEALEKSLLKVQSALAIQQGVDGLRASYKALGSATGIATKAQAALNFVINLNPFVLIVTGITLAIAALLKFTSFLDPVIDKLKNFGDAIGLTNYAEKERAEEQKKRHEEFKKQQAERIALFENEIGLLRFRDEKIQKSYDNEIKLRKAAGKDFADIEKAKLQTTVATEAKILKQRIDKLNEFKKQGKTLMVAIAEEQAKAQLDVVKNAQADLKILENKNLKERLDNYKNYAAERLSIARQIEDIENGLLEDGIEKELEINRDKFRRLREDAEKNTKLTRKERARLIELFDEQELAQQKVIDAKYEKIRQDKIDKEKAELQELVDFNEELRLKEIEDNKAKNLQIIEDNKVAAAKQKEIDEKAKADAKEIQDFKFDIASQGLQTISNLTELFAGKSEKAAKKAFQVQKAVSIAQATIDTYKSANAIFASTAANPITVLNPSAPFIAAGVAVAAGLVNVASIASQKFQGGGSTGGGGTESAPDLGGGATPNFNVVGDSGINQLAQLQSTPTQAYVVSGEVTTSQALDRNRVQNATL